MADNIQVNDNILVELDYQNICLIDPNKVVNLDGTVRERQIHPENLVMYANLEAKMIPRSKLVVGAGFNDAVQTTPIASINFLRPNGDTMLSNKYLDQITGLNSVSGKGTNQPQLNNISQQNKTEDFYVKQNTSNRVDTGLLGIESIKIKNTRSLTPTVDITLVDVQGRALFEKGENSEYAAFFNLPYPTFYLTLKGYYGKAVKYQLIMTNFSTSFDSNTGNYRVDLKFYSYKYTILAELQMGALFALPFMYTTDYRISTTTPQTGSVNAAIDSNSSNGNPNLSLTQSIRSTKGQEEINKVYKLYKAQGLIDQNLPELSFPELRNRLFRLEENINKSYGEADFTPLTNINTYSSYLTSLRDDVLSSDVNSWFGQYIDQDKIFVLNTQNTGGESNIITYIYKPNIINDKQLSLNAYNQLKKIVNGYKTELGSNATLGKNGSYTIDGKTTQSQINTLSSLEIAVGTTTLNVADSVRKSLSALDIDWNQTFLVRNKREPLKGEVQDLINKESQFFIPIVLSNASSTNFPTYNFVFDGTFRGKSTFNKIIDLTYGEVSKVKEQVIIELGLFLEKKIEGDSNLGFKPTLRNIMAMIFASAEAFIRLLDNVHTEAWKQRLNPIRQRVVVDGAKSSTTTESKNYVQQNNNNTVATEPIFPWPLYFVETNSPTGEQFEIRYLGDSREVAFTRGNNFEIWPEVQFVEEYIKGLAQRVTPTIAPTGSQDTGRSIERISINAVDFPMTNIPYSNYQTVKFLYEIYERVLIAVYYDGIAKNSSKQLSVYKTLSDIEVTNITTSLTSTSPSLTKILKNLNFNSTDYLAILRNISNDGTGPSWQQFIRGEFTSEYMRTITTQDYSLLDAGALYQSADSLSTSKNVKSLENVVQYLDSSTSNDTTSLLALYPFVSNTWSAENLSNSKQNLATRYSTTNSIFINDNKKFITNYQPSFDQNTNRPFVDFNFLISKTPEVENSNFTLFYNTRNFTKNYLVTESIVQYNGQTGNVDVNQTTSMLNTPFFVNALLQSINYDRLNSTQYPYVAPAYLLLNSLPLSTLREQYKRTVGQALSQANNINDINTDLDYLFAAFTQYGAIHKLPYAWVLKYGSIWHRYKKYITDNIDILDANVWTNVNIPSLYDPNGSDLETQYTFRNQNNVPVEIVAQKSVTSSSTFGLNNTISTVNVGFYPRVVNELYYMMTGTDLFTTYSDAEMQSAVNSGMNVDYIPDSQIVLPFGFDNNNLSRTLNYNTWYVSFDTRESPAFQNVGTNKTVVIPSFGSNYNQVSRECFLPSSTGLIMTQEVDNNTAIFNGSVRTFWNAPNYGYFELSSITKPNYDEYFKFVNSTNVQNSFELSQKYSNIEEIFGVFKTEILDTFEQEFLNFSKSVRDLSADDIIGNMLITGVSNTNFQTLLTKLLTIDVVDNKINQTDYVANVADVQMNNMTSILNNFINADICFKYGNPGNFNRKVFGTFTTLPTPYKVVDPYTYNAYVQGTLPTDGGTVTLAQSKANNPTAWNAMYLNVGFADEAGMVYSDNGSYYTDFFPTMNVEFTETNVKTFAPLIKIFGTQKYNLRSQFPIDTYSKADFTDSLNNFYLQRNGYLNDVINQVFSSLQKDLPNVTETVEKPILSAIDGLQPKVELYETFKAFNDKWIAGLEITERTLYQDVMFLDRANNDIGDKVLVDVFKLIEFFSGTTSVDTRVIDFISQIVADNKFIMMPLPAYVNFWGVGEVKQGVTPNAESSESLANSMFGTYLDVDTRYSEPKFVCYYAGKPSEHLDMREAKDYRWRTDAFDISSPASNPIIVNLINKKNWSISNKIVGFNVDFGTRNQTIFSSLQLDQNPAAATTEANKVIADMANAAAGRRTNTQSVSLYNLYKNRSYECRIEAMGNMMIQPTQYFNLRYVPMFRGPYMVQSVEHIIEPGTFKTFFSGIRMPIYSLPLITKQIMSINQNLLSELAQSVFRLKETSVTAAQPVVNIITIGNNIQVNTKYNTAPFIICYKDIDKAYPDYQQFTGIENQKFNISISDFAKLLKTRVNNPFARLMVFYTAYLNGHDDKILYTYNHDLGNTPLGGVPHPQISYGGKKVYFTTNYACKTNQNGYTTPHAVFQSFEKSIDFIYNYFYNPTKPINSLLYTLYPKWDIKNEADTIIQMTNTWVYYWPTQNYTSTEQLDNFLRQNETTRTKLYESASNVIQLCKTYKLI